MTILTILLTLALLTGVGLLLYPAFSDLWNRYHQSRVVVNYAQVVSDMGEEERSLMEAEAMAWNEKVAKRSPHWELTEEEQAEYESLLDVTGTGIMGYVEIPEIHVSLPIYHGTEEGVLQQAAGHIEGSSLPIGGESTHSVLSGHRGLPSARLFTDLDRLTEGSMFYLHVLGRTLTYRVDQILTVEPDELESLEIEAGEDYCTLVTCTPYGINSHRLLVRGRRLEADSGEETETAAAEAVWIPETDDRLLLAVGAVGGLLLLIVLWALFRRSRRRKKRS